MSKTEVQPPPYNERGRAYSPSVARNSHFKSPSARPRNTSGSPNAPRDMPRSERRSPELVRRVSPVARFDHSPEHSKKRPAPARSMEPELPSLIQRRGPEAIAKMPRLHLDQEKAHNAYPEAAPQMARSAPPHQHSFGPDAHLPPPSRLFRARERDFGYAPLSNDAAYDDPRKVSPSHTVYYDPVSAPSSATPRTFMPHAAALPSPAYHANHLGHGRPDYASDASDETYQRMSANKMQFLALFSDFYESLSDSRTLKVTLEYQIRSSNALLHTLQRSNKVFDETVDRRVRQESQAWESRFARLEDRLDRMDARLADALAHITAEPRADLAVKPDHHG